MNATLLKALVALAASSHSFSWFGNLVPYAGSIPHQNRFQANRKRFNTPNVLEHSPENRETVECISQFAMLLGVYNRQSP